MDEENRENNENDEQERRDSIYECGIVETENSRGRIRSLNIIGTIEGHNLLPSGTKSTKYEHVLPQLVAVEEDESIDGLLVLLNTVGGDVGSRSCDGGDDCRNAKADCVAGVGRKSFNRRSVGSFDRQILHRSIGNDDYTPDAHKRRCNQCYADISLSYKNAGQDYRIYCAQFRNRI